MPLAGMDDGVALGAEGLEHGLDRADRGACQRDVIAHRVDIAAGRAEIGLHATGKVRHFGVSNQTPGQIELLKSAVKQPLLFNQVQFSITHANLVAQGIAANMLSNVLKLVFNRHRPDVEASTHVFTASFPSGHATMSAVVYLTLGVLLAKSAPSRGLRSYFIGLAILLAFLVGVSRIYLGMHYPTDVIAGWCVGISWAMLCWAAVDLIEHYEGRHSPRR